MAAKLTRLTHKIAIKLHLVVESYIICSSRFRRPVRKLLDTPSYIVDDRMIQNDGLGGMWEREPVAYFKIRPQNFLGLGKTTKDLRQDSHLQPENLIPGYSNRK
jgi:hypothetical protein